MLQVSFNFKSVEDALAALAKLTGSPVLSEPVPVPVAAKPAAPAPVVAEATEPKKRGRPAKKEALEAAHKLKDDPIPADDLEVVAPEPEVEKTDFTEDDVRAALQVVADAKGLDAVRTLLVEATGKSRISEVDPATYPALVKAAKAKL